MRNSDLGRIFRDIANILEIKGDNPFRIRAYERASQNIEALSEDIESYARQDRLREIPGIGEDLSNKIREFLRTDKIKMYEDLKKATPEGLLDLLNIPSVGPKTAKLLYQELKIKNIADLGRAIKKNKLAGIFGIKEKTVENISKGIELLKRGRERMPLAQAMQAAEEFVSALKKAAPVKKVSVGGSLRRQKETVRDIDILVISDNPQKVMGVFVRLPQVAQVLAKGETKSSVRTKDDVQLDCRVVEEKSFGAALLYFTGSKNFNIKLRQIAIRKGLKLNEYGIFRNKRFIAGRREEEIFKTLGLVYVEPELREDTGEIELARQDKLPQLVETKDIRGDFHVHSSWSDGRHSIGEMAKACLKKGYSYVAITDHSQGLRIAGGLSVADLRKKRLEINGLNKQLKNFRILHGAEVDIDARGRLDYRDDVLKGFDIVIAAIHSGFKQSKKQLTQRITRACQNKYVHIIAHPTGRLWGERNPYEIDLEEILKVARETNTHLEINAFGRRLDLNSAGCRQAKEKGVKLAIGTDAHSVWQLDYMNLGVAVARRGWLGKDDVINTLSVEEVLKEARK
jgi:DNA polymerase (family 10)